MGLISFENLSSVEFQLKKNCIRVCPCVQRLTCSDRELLYFFDMRFLIVSFTDLTFLPSEIRDVVGDLTTSLYMASWSLLCQ